MLCSEIQLVKSADGFEDIKPLPCNRWSCEYCGYRRRTALVALAASGEPNKILTLTVNPERGTSANHRRDMLHDAWKRLVKRILRRFAWKTLDYMAFLERTKAGEPHLHILLRCGFIPQRWLAEQMRQLIGAPIVWIEKINGTAQAIRYVTKYVAKAPAQFGCGKRYWVSRRWVVSPAPPIERTPLERGTYTVSRERWAETIQHRTNSRYSWEWVDEGWCRFYRPGTFGDAYGERRRPERQESG